MIIATILILFVYFSISVSVKRKMLCDRLRYYVTLYKIWYVKCMGKYRGIIKTVINFIVFWIVFLWNDGVIISGLSKGIKDFLNLAKDFEGIVSEYWVKLKDTFIYLSPYGREVAQNEQFQYCLIFGSVIALVSFLVYLFALQDEYNWLISIIVSPLASFAMWYLFYFACLFLKVYAITAYFYLWASILSILIAVGSFLIITFILVTLLLE